MSFGCALQRCHFSFSNRCKMHESVVGCRRRSSGTESGIKGDGASKLFMHDAHDRVDDGIWQLLHLWRCARRCGESGKVPTQSVATRRMSWNVRDRMADERTSTPPYQACSLRHMDPCQDQRGARTCSLRICRDCGAHPKILGISSAIHKCWIALFLCPERIVFLCCVRGKTTSPAWFATFCTHIG